jgi:hypothetical protein
VPVQYQKPDEPGSIGQAVEIFAETVEISPYASDYKPAYPQALVPNYSGYGVAATGVNGNGSTSPSASQVPDPYDLTWVASDTAQFSFFFKNVCWTETDPSPTLYPWAMTKWSAQVRTTSWYYYGYWWPPMFPLGRYLMAFTVTTKYMENDAVLGTGTLVTLTGGSFWPGNFRWDLQADTYADPVGNPDVFTSRTWLAGKATIQGQVTSPMIYPPSNWPIYQYA